MTQQSPIFVKTQAFMLWLLDHTRKFPKYERFRLAKQLEDGLFAFHHHLIHATKTDNPHAHLNAADIQLTKIRAYLRLALELKYTSANQYQHAATHTTELGKLLGGWLNSLP